MYRAANNTTLTAKLVQAERTVAETAGKCII
jgi:hypothetical protein